MRSKKDEKCVASVGDHTHIVDIGGNKGTSRKERSLLIIIKLIFTFINHSIKISSDDHRRPYVVYSYIFLGNY